MKISLFALSMGFCGLTFSWTTAGKLWEIPFWLVPGLSFLTTSLYLLLVFLYVKKIICQFAAVREEWQAPQTAGFFVSFGMASVLLAAILFSWSFLVSFFLWLLGTLALFGIILALWLRFLRERQQLINLNPGWLLVLISPLTVPLAGLLLPVPGAKEVAIFSLASGLFLGLPGVFFFLKEAVFDKQLGPGLLVLLTPFGMAYLDYTGIFGVDTFSTLLLACGGFLSLPLSFTVFAGMRKTPFSLQWWSTGFPFMAFTNALLHQCVSHPASWLQLLCACFLLGGTVLILYLSVRTFIFCRYR